MPHIMMEYSKDLAGHVDIAEVVTQMHKALADQGIGAERIKCRAMALDYAVVGDKGLNGLMAHTTLSLLEGRDIATKQQYANAIYDVMKRIIGETDQACKLTLDVRDMTKDTYMQ